MPFCWAFRRSVLPFPISPFLYLFIYIFFFTIYLLLYIVVASLRNLGERTAKLFRSKKNNAEQSAQDAANQTEDAAVNLKNDLKNEVGETTG